MAKSIKLKINSETLYPYPYFPIGYIYMSVNSTNPSTFFGGTWEQIKDVFLLGCGSLFSAGSTGGEASHTLTVNEMPSHNHKVVLNAGTSVGTYNNACKTNNYINQYNANSVSYEGGSQPHNNMPPYLTVYMWKKTKN